MEKFCAKHKLSFKIVSGEASAVDTNIVEEWERMLPSLTSSYAPKDNFNVDETDLFFRTLPEKPMCLKGETCTGGKVSKE